LSGPCQAFFVSVSVVGVKKILIRAAYLGGREI